jgi:electron transport complex protein RnfG
MSIKKDFVMPVIVLLFICLFVSGALAVINNITDPVIKAAAAMRAAAAKKEIIPQADDFEQLTIDNLRNEGKIPRTVTEVHRATNDTGFIFAITVIGYGGEIKLLCGVDPDGRVIRTAILAHTETQGLGTPIFEAPHAGQYWGRDKGGIEGIAAISGATITSVAFKNAIRDALTAFQFVKN